MRKLVLYLTALGMAAGILGCGLANNGGNDAQTSQQGQDKNREVASYLTGDTITQGIRDTRPLAVMFNNIEAGCPQTGISEAAIIYEAPVEGRITRLMGIFEDYTKVEKIGSIRSSRDYFVYFAMEYDALYAHFGQATPYVGELLNSNRVDNISGAVSGIDKPSPAAFYRSSDRKAPHNVYLNTDNIEQYIKKFQYRRDIREDYVPKFEFASQKEPVLYEDAKDAVVLYPGGKSATAANGFSKVKARFEYNEKDGLYYRYQYGNEQIDEATGEQLTYTNVVFQYCHGEVRDANDYLAFGCHGDDGYKVQVFTKGKVVEGTWSRMADELPASYVDEEGNPILLNPGKTWICIIWDEYSQDVVIE